MAAKSIEAMQHRHFVLFILALTQITGWGAVSVLPVLARNVSNEFETPLSFVFLGTSVMFIAMALTAPMAGRAFRRFTTRRVMAAGACLIGLGLCFLSLASSLAVFWIVWALIGVAGAMFLTTAAYAWLAEYADHRARSLIGTLMLVTGLAGSVFWPMTAFLEHLVGWRGAVLIYGGVMLLVGLLVRFGLPPTPAPDLVPTSKGPARRGRVFTLLFTAIALNSFVTFGIEAVGIELLRNGSRAFHCRRGCIASWGIQGRWQGGRPIGRTSMGWDVHRPCIGSDDPTGSCRDLGGWRKLAWPRRLPCAFRYWKRSLRRRAGNHAARFLLEGRLCGGDVDHRAADEPDQRSGSTSDRCTSVRDPGCRLFSPFLAC